MRTHESPSEAAAWNRRVAGAGRAATAADQRGLTLIELLIGISLLVITLAVAAPDLSRWGQSTRALAQAADLQSALGLARTEAQRRGVRVGVCARAPAATGDSGRCAPDGVWQSGWLVFTDNVHLLGNRAGVVDGADVVLRVADPARDARVQVQGNLGSWLAYTPQGALRSADGAASGSLTFCQGTKGRRLSVTAAGALRASEETCAP